MTKSEGGRSWRNREVMFFSKSRMIVDGVPAAQFRTLDAHEWLEIPDKDLI